MHATIYLVIPEETPEINLMLESLLEPWRRQEHMEQQGAWHYWDYWYYWNPQTREEVHSWRDCVYYPSEFPDPDLAAGVITPDRQFYDLYTASRQKPEHVIWHDLLDSQENHILVVIRIHC